MKWGRISPESLNLFWGHLHYFSGGPNLGPNLDFFEQQRGYLYQNGIEFRQKVIGAGLNLFWGHLHYFSGGIWTFPLLSDTYASAPIAERAILFRHPVGIPSGPVMASGTIGHVQVVFGAKNGLIFFFS